MDNSRYHESTTPKSPPQGEKNTADPRHRPWRKPSRRTVLVVIEILGLAVAVIALVRGWN
ncbi:hypothetical protein J3R03_010041 [Actinoplanes couchii]|uniref:Uncharacterized protein n=1 Tax=Actinoplanes couchii TaxID=403638 RepID=A0ABQ3X917_9ACTN|nr:hypothetical protein [Actinoplanes couchii]GID54987.1 hypothetical protein Aco03nite_033910 [Actinoplanes couchii]